MRGWRRRCGERHQFLDGRAQRFGESNERVGPKGLLTLLDQHKRGPREAHGLGQLELRHAATEASDVQAQGAVELGLTIDHAVLMIAPDTEWCRDF